jgi:hypothetical protein
MRREIGDFIRSGAFRAVPRKEFSKFSTADHRSINKTRGVTDN